MNYLCYLFLSSMIHVEEESRFIDGREQPCLIIPTETNQIKRGKHGTWLMILRLAECPPNRKQITHEIQQMCISADMLNNRDRYRRELHKMMHLGRVYEHDRTPSKKIDRTNLHTDIECVGDVILSDIPKHLLRKEKETGKRYLSGLRFCKYGDNDVVYTGFICVDDIPKQYILTDTDTGKRYVRARFRKLERLDTYMNTHHLVIDGPEGSEIEIGRFKEWAREGAASHRPALPEPEHNTTITPRPPMSVDGIKF